MLSKSSIVGHPPRAHRWIATICCCLTAVAWSHVVRAQQFPYGAKVTSKTATVRSGPGANYYHTDRLPQGSRVEVYRHDDSWAAIRPPEGSYSWVLASAIELTADSSLGHVATEGERTRIGSRFGDDHHAHYVTLQLGETVHVIGRRTLIDADKTSLWYQIQPPAGEFRWLRLSSLDPLPNALAVLKKNAVSEQPTIHPAQFLEDTPGMPSSDAGNADGIDSVDANSSGPAANRGDETRGRETWTLDTPGAEPQPLAIAKASRPEPEAPAFRPLDTAAAEVADFRPRRSAIDAGLLRQEIAKINAELSQQIVRDPTQWQLGDFRARTQAVIDLSSTNDLRAQAQSLLSRITQFQDIQRRHQNILRIATESLLANNGEYASPTYADFDIPGKVADPMVTSRQSQTPGSAYDGMGWLMPVVTRHPGLPRYALTDDNGNILQFVSPLPGLNLHNYERRRIAVIGRRGFVPRFNKAHLTAERVISLDRVRY